MVDGHRLAYLDEAPVNWCPGLGTVLANEEVTAEGRSERGNFPVFRRPLRQWKMRITAYADRLLADLDLLDWPEPIKLMQRNWIGRSEGARITFPVAGGPGIEVFTTRPDTLFGATYMVLAPEHPLVDELTAAGWPDGRAGVVDRRRTPRPAEAVAAYRRQAAGRSEVERQAESREKTGVFIGAYATNPATGGDIPVFIADYVLMGYGTGAIMAVPGQDERDWEFAEDFDLPIVRTVQPPDDWDGKAYVGEGPAINSANDEVSLDGLGVDEAKAPIIELAGGQGPGRRDRHLQAAGLAVQPPALLGRAVPHRVRPRRRAAPGPARVDAAGRAARGRRLRPRHLRRRRRDVEPEPPLARATDWVTVELDLGEGEGTKTYRRELNTMPQWAGSCWYELRYLDPDQRQALRRPRERALLDGPAVGRRHRRRRPVRRRRRARRAAPAVRPLLAQGPVRPGPRVLGRAVPPAVQPGQDPGRGLQATTAGIYVEAAEVVERDGGFCAGRPGGHPGATARWARACKNSVTPDEMYESYGADTLRLYEMFTGPLDQSRPWETRAVVGVYRLLQRIWRNVVDEETGEVTVSADAPDDETLRVLHRTVAAVRAGMENLRFNVSIAKITELNNHLTTRYPAGGVPRTVAEPLVLMLAPLAPHVAEELWSRLGHAGLAGHGAVPRGRPRLAGRRHGRGAGAGQRQGAGTRWSSRPAPTPPRWRPRPGPTTGWPACCRDGRCARSSPCPAG